MFYLPTWYFLPKLGGVFQWVHPKRIPAARLRMQTNHMLRCTICKSGTAMVEGEEDPPLTRSAFCQTDDGRLGSFHGMDLHGFSEKKEIFVATLGEQLQHDQSTKVSPKKTLSKPPPRCTFCWKPPLGRAQNGLSWMNELMCGGEPSCHLSSSAWPGRRWSLNNKKDASKKKNKKNNIPQSSNLHNPNLKIFGPPF